MKIEKATTGSRTTNEAKRNILASIEFAVRASLHGEYVDADFVHSILGKISAKSEGRGDEEDVGYIKASLVQFGEALDHGISTARLGDGIDGNIAEYWELLFDLDTGCWKEEVQDEYGLRMRPVNHRLHGDQSEISRKGSRPNCHRQDYRHLRSRLWAGSLQTLAAAIYSSFRPRSECIEKIESARCSSQSTPLARQLLSYIRHGPLHSN